MPARFMRRLGMTRRDLLAAGLAAVGASPPACRLVRARRVPFAAEEGDYGPFKMGLQSYSLRGLHRPTARPT